MTYDSPVLVVYRGLMLICAFGLAAMVSIAIFMYAAFVEGEKDPGVHFGQVKINKASCEEIAQDTKAALLDGGASEGRADAKATKVLNICLIGRENDSIEYADH